jgi:hypothetical protein
MRRAVLLVAQPQKHQLRGLWSANYATLTEAHMCRKRRPKTLLSGGKGMKNDRRKSKTCNEAAIFPKMAPSSQLT